MAEPLASAGVRVKVMCVSDGVAPVLVKRIVMEESWKLQTSLHTKV
jgi:hypothetical protein